MTLNLSARIKISVALAIVVVIATTFVYGKDLGALSPAELKAVYKAVGLSERNGVWLDACNQPLKFQPQTDVVDLNGDGQSEVFVLVGGSCYGATYAQLSLLIKDRNGRWKRNLGFPAVGYEILPTKNRGFPDIAVKGRWSCFPVWRWNGKEYDIHKRCDR